MNILYSPANAEINGLNFYQRDVGFGQIEAPMSTIDEYRYGNAVVTLADMEPPRKIEVPNSEYVSIRGNGLWLYDPSVAVPIIRQVISDLLK